jgi:ribonucleotide monophosphatase NagD (HAD superfamily)
VDAQALKSGVEISKYFMIGDNPAGDIRGANQMGWESILVRTGVYKPGD